MSIWSRRVTQQPTVLAATRVGRGAVGASLCREPSQYRHIASGSPPRPASHIASVAHVPSYEIGSRPRYLISARTRPAPARSARPPSAAVSDYRRCDDGKAEAEHALHEAGREQGRIDHGPDPPRQFEAGFHSTAYDAGRLARSRAAEATSACRTR